MELQKEGVPLRIHYLMMQFFTGELEDKHYSELENWVNTSNENLSFFSQYMCFLESTFLQVEQFTDGYEKREERNLVIKYINETISPNEIKLLCEKIPNSLAHAEFFKYLPDTRDKYVLFAHLLKTCKPTGR